MHAHCGHAHTGCAGFEAGKSDHSIVVEWNSVFDSHFSRNLYLCFSSQRSVKRQRPGTLVRRTRPRSPHTVLGGDVTLDNKRSHHHCANPSRESRVVAFFSLHLMCGLLIQPFQTFKYFKIIQGFSRIFINLHRSLNATTSSCQRREWDRVPAETAPPSYVSASNTHTCCPWYANSRMMYPSCTCEPYLRYVSIQMP